MLKLKKQNIRTILLATLAVVLVAYLVMALAFTSQLASTRLCRGIRVEVADTSRTGFVKASELEHELGDLFTGAAGTPLDRIDLQAIEDRLSEIDKIEEVNAVIMTDDSVHVRVTPLIPVARVFDGNDSYYINASGKRIKADARYTMDVPVVRGNFSAAGTDLSTVLPLVRYIEERDNLRELYSMVDVAGPRDVYLIPDIRGQVIAFGSPEGMPEKFSRIEKFYHEVLPLKGWNYYDTISVKWDGQVVATRSKKRRVVEMPVEIEKPDTSLAFEGINLNADSLVFVKMND